MKKYNVYARERLLPTYLWENDKPPSNNEASLREITASRLHDFVRIHSDESDAMRVPPQGLIDPIVEMNVGKRTTATRAAEKAIESGTVNTPPFSIIPTLMASGFEIPGIDDLYMKADHPSQELFAYNRIGKTAWLNRRFGRHCLRAIELAHPAGDVEPIDDLPRVKAHSADRFNVNDPELNEWRIVSTKSPIAAIRENDRTAMLISRVTGAVDLTHPSLTDAQIEAIDELSAHETVPPHFEDAVLAQKALLAQLLFEHDDTPEGPFYPVLQTVYLTQVS